MHTHGADIKYNVVKAKRSYDARVREKERLEDRKNATTTSTTGSIDTTSGVTNANTVTAPDPD